MNAAIRTVGLSKQYGDVRAVNGLSLCVDPGEIYAFLGLNGAGKSTTIRMLLGLVKPTGGTACVLGQEVPAIRGESWNAVGYMMERPHAYRELTVRENLEAVRRLRPGTTHSAVSAIIDQLGLSRYAERRAGTLSQGNAQRLGLAKALIHRPELLILDEPANGLDPAGIVEIRRLLRDLVRQQGVTVFLSSHILGEVARLADRIGIIHHGRLLQELDKVELERQRRRWLAVQTRDTQAAQAALHQAGYMPTNGQNGSLQLWEEAVLARPEEVATLLVNAGHAPTMLKVEHEDLEHYFLRLVGMEPEKVL